MKYPTLPRMILGMLLVGSSGFLFASEADNLREQVNAMLKEASIIAERGKQAAELGNKELAERLEQGSVKLREGAEQMALKAREREKNGERSSNDEQVRRLKDRHQDLIAKAKHLQRSNAPENELAEVSEQIGVASRELRMLHGHDTGLEKLPPELRAHADKLEAAGRRIHHLQVAAENLKMAEAHDLAHDILEKAESMERDVQEQKRRLAAEVQNREHKERGSEHVAEIVQDLKKEMEHLRAEVNELRQKLGDR